MQHSRQIDRVIFDFHGTMTDHNKRLIESLTRACTDIGIDPDTMVKPFMEGLPEQSALGIPQKVYLQRFIEPHLFGALWERFSLYRDILYLPVEGLKETIQELREEGVSILFLTNGTVVGNFYAKQIGESESYANIIWKILVEDWGIYSGEGDDIPLVLSIDDFKFISRRTRSVPKEFFHRLPGGGDMREDYTIHFDQAAYNAIRKPNPLLYDAVGRVMTLVDEVAFDPKRTLFVTDYKEDGLFGTNHGMPTMMFVKGMRQYAEFCGEDGAVKIEQMHPYFHMREIPQFCQYGDAVIRTCEVINQEKMEITARVEGHQIYQIRTGVNSVEDPEFIIVDDSSHNPEQEY